MAIGNTALTILRTFANAGRPLTKMEALAPVIPWEKKVHHKSWGHSYFALRITKDYLGNPNKAAASSLFLKGYIEQAGKQGNAILWTLTPAGHALINKT